MFGIEAGRVTRRFTWPAAAFAALAPVALAQDTRPAAPPPPILAPLEQRVEAFVAALEAKRKELGVVGAAIVVAQGDRIVRIVGLGQRSADKPEPVTEDTLFQIASVTKQFTAIGVALAVGEGKMAFEDHPRRFVPSFRLKDSEADAKVNLIDLLAHRSGLDRSDFTFRFGSFTQDELIQLAARSAPAAKLRTKFLYNNTMYSLAGVALGRAYGTTYERFMTERLLMPLGMRSSTFSFEAFVAAPNRAQGYAAPAGAAPAAMQALNLVAIGPAGSLNATARDMGAWLRFLNAGGQSAGVRIAPAAYARVFENHQPDGVSAYGLGFQLHTRSGVRVAEHGGDTLGYAAQVVHLPERQLSYALLTNQNASNLRSTAYDLFWDLVVKPELRPEPKAEPAPQSMASAAPIAPDVLAGHYFKSNGNTFEMAKDGNAIMMVWPDLPRISPKATGVNRYDLPGFDGITASFVESAALPGRLVAWFHMPPSQPGSIAYFKKDAAWLARAKAEAAGPDAGLIGFYHSIGRKKLLEIVPYKGGVALLDTVDEPRLLTAAGPDLFRIDGRPVTHRLLVRRGRSKNIIGFALEEPDQTLEMIAESASPAGRPEEARAMLDRAVAAAGGAEALDRLVSRTSIGRAVAATHGVDGPTETRIVPGKLASFIEVGAFGKTIVELRLVTNEQEGRLTYFGGVRVDLTGKALAAARLGAVPHPLYRWKERFAQVAMAGEAIVNGEHVYVIEMTPAGLEPTRLYISADTYMVLREETPAYFGDTFQQHASADYSDYRTVNGIRVPFAASSTVPMLGGIVLKFDSVTLDAPIDPKAFEVR